MQRHYRLTAVPISDAIGRRAVRIDEEPIRVRVVEPMRLVHARAVLKMIDPRLVVGSLDPVRDELVQSQVVAVKARDAADEDIRPFSISCSADQM